MRNAASKFRGFTLVELIMVMAILVLIASVIAPSLRGFGIGRKTNDAARMIVGLAQYARAQSAAEGRVYRMNLDERGHSIWLTTGDAGVFAAPTNDFGTRYSLPDGVQMTVITNPQANSQLNVPPNVQQVTVQGPPLLEQSGSQPNTLMQNQHDTATPTYVEFQPSGRTDPTTIHLSDSLGHKVDVACRSATEMFHIVTDGEVLR
jgi:type II secretion system protein H